MRLILLGAPGTGKGTQGALLEEYLQVPRISTGEMLRAAIADGTKVGLEAKAYLDAGQLVPDEVVTGIVKERLSMDDAAAGFILDGYPRTVSQAEAFDQFLKENNSKLDGTIFLDVAEKNILARLAGRRSCSACGMDFNVTMRPHEWEIRDCRDRQRCQLVYRSDDKPDVVVKRLKVYQQQTAPLFDYYTKQGCLIEIDGFGSVEEVFERIRKEL